PGRAVHLVGAAVDDQASLVSDHQPQCLVQLLVPQREHPVADLDPAGHPSVLPAQRSNTPSMRIGTTSLMSTSPASSTSTGTPACASSRPDTQPRSNSGIRSRTAA